MPHRISTVSSIRKLTESVFQNFNPSERFKNECFKLIEEDGNYFPFVALGLISRLCVGNMPAKDRKAILRKFPTSEHPAKRVNTWWKCHREQCWNELEAVTLKKISAMTTAIFDMRDCDLESLTEMATTWVKKRDNVESVVRLIGADANRLVIPLLAEADRLSIRFRNHFSTVNFDQRLTLVAESDRTAWWVTHHSFWKEARERAA